MVQKQTGVERHALSQEMTAINHLLALMLPANTFVNLKNEKIEAYDEV